MRQEEKIEKGRKLFESAQWRNSCAVTEGVAKVTACEVWTSSHNDTAIYVDLEDREGNTLWRARYDVYLGSHAEEDADALSAYLQYRFQCPGETKELI